jgi:hypothetical protein
MVTRMKVSQVKRRVKQRSERKSRHNNKANLVRSRKQRARKTARKMMRGGAEETINIGIQQSGDANVVVKDAISLKFSHRLIRNDTLFMSIDIDIYKGDVRKLLNFLFHIDGFDPNKTHNQTFLMGLADYPGREKTKKAALNRVTNDCIDVDNVKSQVQELINQTFSKINLCNLEIELIQGKNDITFIVKKYHRMKVDKTSCKNKISFPIDRYYPTLEFAGSKSGFMGSRDGDDYMDFNTGDVYTYDENQFENQFLERDEQKNLKKNLFTFTVKDKTIDVLKSELNKLNPIMVINEDPTTAAIEEQKNKEAAEAAKQAEEAVKQAEEARKTDAETNFDRVSDNKVKDKNKLKEAIKVISSFISWIIKWRQKNNYDDWVIDWYNRSKYDTIEKKLEEFSKKRQEINKEFESEYTPQERDKITESLKICRQEYHKFTNDANDAKIFREYLNSMNSMSMNYDYYYKIAQGLREYLNLNDKYVEDYAKNEITALWNQVFDMPYDSD